MSAPTKVQAELLELMAKGRELTTWARGLSFHIIGRRSVTSRTVNPMLAAAWIEKTAVRDYAPGGNRREFVYSITAAGRQAIGRAGAR